MSSSFSTLRTLAFAALTSWTASAAAAPAPNHPGAARHPASVPTPGAGWRFGTAPAKASGNPHHGTAAKPNRATGTQTVPGMRPDQITHH